MDRNAQEGNVHRTAAALILGAGWSAAAGFPLTNDLIQMPATSLSQRALARHYRVINSYQHWVRGRTEPQVEEFLAESDRGLTGVAGEWVSELIQVRLGLVGAALSTRRSPRNGQRVIERSGSELHREFWLELVRRYDIRAIVTTNYDILAERVVRPTVLPRVGTPGFHYGGLPQPHILIGNASPFTTAFRGHRLTGRVPLFKLHGSLNWVRRAGRIDLYHDLRPAFRRGGEAAIVAPMREKDAPEWLVTIWRGAESTLSDCDEWIVVGYSLPNYDAAVQALFRRASRSRLKRAQIYSRRKKTAKHWAAILGSAVEASYRGPLG